VPFDRVLRGGLVVDGTGAPARVADVAIEGERLAAIGEGLTGAEEIDCSGHVVCPGFLDTHSHSDLKVLADPDLPMKVRQGITTEVFGQDGISVAPVREEDRDAWKRKLAGLLGDFGVVWDWTRIHDYLVRIARAHPVPNVAYLAPHGALRQYAIGGDARPATTIEIANMQVLLGEALADGACGMSTGLIYPPCCYAETAELVGLGRILADSKKPLVVHMRSESDYMLEALDEMIGVARVSGCAVHVSHLKIAGRENWGSVDDVLARIDAARAEGLLITADQYPYAAGSTMLGAILPPWAHDGGTDATLARLRDVEARKRLRAEMTDPAPSRWDNFWKWSGPQGIVVADIPSGRHPEWLGRNLTDVARDRGQEPVEAALDLLLEESMGVAMISFSQDDAVVERLWQRPWVNACTDGLLGGRPHPRAYGTYPRILGHFLRERSIGTLEETIRKLTSQAADVFGLAGVGRLVEGAFADIVVFSAENVRDRATFDDPQQYPEGIRDVVVGGQVVLRDGALTGARPGRLLA
jgi:N-acyl-D-amino-acid deacylase